VGSNKKITKDQPESLKDILEKMIKKTYQAKNNKSGTENSASKQNVQLTFV
jgi:hypothetical protein